MLTPEEVIAGLRPCHYRYNQTKRLGDKINFGFIAQDILDAFGEEYNFIQKDNDGEFYTVNYFQFIAPLVSVVQKQQREIEHLKVALEELKKGKDQL